MAHRTALIAAATIAVVVFAGAIAVGVNLGILKAADSRPVGKLSASAAAQPAGPVLAVAPAAATVPAAATTTPPPQNYVIKKVGEVSLSSSKTGLHLADVKTDKGWKWTLTQSSDSQLTVTFKHGSSTYTLKASLGPHRAIVAKVDHPVTKTVPSAPSSTVVASSAAPPAAPAAAPTGGGESEGGSNGGAEYDD